LSPLRIQISDIHGKSHSAAHSPNQRMSPVNDQSLRQGMSPATSNSLTQAQHKFITRSTMQPSPLAATARGTSAYLLPPTNGKKTSSTPSRIKKASHLISNVMASQQPYSKEPTRSCRDKRCRDERITADFYRSARGAQIAFEREIS